MKIGYKLSEKDYVDFNINHYRTSEGHRKQINQIMIVSMIAVFLCCIVAGYFKVFPMWYAAITGVVGAVVMGVVFKKLIPRSIRKQVPKMLSKNDNKTLLGYRDLELKEEGIHNKSEYEESLIRWEAVNRISESEEHIFIYNTSISALIIPKRVFKSEAEQSEFLRIIGEKTS